MKNLKNVLKETHSLSEYRNIKEQVEVGMCNFKVLKDKHCWLNLIKLENPNFKRYGIPSCLLKLMEEYAKGQYAYYVEGKYIPQSDGVEEFYNKNHYKIGDDGYRSIVEKSLITYELNYDHLKKYVDNIEDIKLEKDNLLKTLEFYVKDEDEFWF